MIQHGAKIIRLVAEVKTRSPFGYVAEKRWDEQFALATEVGDIISIHTDRRWGGSFDLVREAKSLTNKPILAKGIHEDDSLIEKAIKAGADYVLVVGRVPAIHTEKLLIEPDSLRDLRKIPAIMKAVWNSRDLQTGGFKQETFADARALFSGWLCQASNVRSIQDVSGKADAVLVGTHLAEFVQSLK